MTVLSESRCLANVEIEFQCGHPSKLHVYKIDTQKSEKEKIENCLCGTHKYYLERQPEIIRKRYKKKQAGLRANDSSAQSTIKREILIHRQSQRLMQEYYLARGRMEVSEQPQSEDPRLAKNGPIDKQLQILGKQMEHFCKIVDEVCNLDASFSG
ncbi:MAG: hypothetical protein Q9191_000569 [Dirinaria sp. TL-2023a]